jgi:hypothetical protein
MLRGQLAIIENMAVQAREPVRALDPSTDQRGTSMTTPDTNNTAQTQGALGYATAFLCTLERHETRSTGWGMAFVANRTISTLLGFPAALIFAAGCWALTDFLVPAVGNNIRFTDLWTPLWPRGGVRGVLSAVDACGLAPALLDRLDVIGAVSVFVVGLWAGNHVRRSIVGLGSPRTRDQFVFLTMAVLIATTAIALCAIHRPPANPVTTAVCVQDIAVSSDL